jgi:hypothetical protein
MYNVDLHPRQSVLCLKTLSGDKARSRSCEGDEAVVGRMTRPDGVTSRVLTRVGSLAFLKRLACAAGPI